MKVLLVPAYPGCPGSKAVKRSLLLLLRLLVLELLACLYVHVHKLAVFVSRES